MMRFRAVSIVAVGVLVLGLASVALGMKEQARPLQPPAIGVGGVAVASPFVMVQAGDTTWIQVHADESRCPGDPRLGHGGEATGGPARLRDLVRRSRVSATPAERWRRGPPSCFKYVDVRSLPSQVGINYWHVDSHRTDQRTYTGSRALWCGSDASGNGKPVECGTWINPPGYGAHWNCVVQLALPASFSVASGCTLYFDPRYDTECKYDYFYVDYCEQRPAWATLATFNATSNNPGGSLRCHHHAEPGLLGQHRRQPAGQLQLAGADHESEPGVQGHHHAGDVRVRSPARRMFRWRFASDGGFSDVGRQRATPTARPSSTT